MLRKPALPTPCLALITDRSLCPGGTLVRKVSEAVEAGVDLVQLREKDLGDSQLLTLARDLREVIGGRALLLINGRADIARAAGADGVHLPEKGGSVADVRRIIGDDALIGRSVHSVAGVLLAQREGADYAQLGSIYPTRSHPGVTPIGAAAIPETAQSLSIPILAVGGIDAERVQDVIKGGAHGVAVVSAILSAVSAADAARKLRSALDVAWIKREATAGKATKSS